MNIGDAAARSGLPAKTIRYYEDIGLIRTRRTGNGYRTFEEEDLETLAFLGRARALGFSIEECRTLLGLHADAGRASSAVKRVAERHLAAVDSRISEMQALRQTLAALISRCPGDGQPDCAILDDLAGAGCAGDRDEPVSGRR